MKLSFFFEKIMQKAGIVKSAKPMTAKEKWMLFLLAGLLLAVIFFPMGEKNSDLIKGSVTGENEEALTERVSENTTMSLSQYENYLSEKLEDMIAQIEGAGKVQAWVTIKSSGEQVIMQGNDRNESFLQEADSVGGTRTEETLNIKENVISGKNGDPYVIKTMQPEVEGVFVVAEGAGDGVVKKNISEAVEVLFGIEAHRIKVAKKKVED